jgi:hypothetical protein
MKLSTPYNFLCAVFAGFIGASLFGLLFHGLSVMAQEDRIVLKAHEFVVMNDENQPVGVLASTTGPGGLPFMSLEGMHGEGQIFVGIFSPTGSPRIGLYGGNGGGEVGLSVFKGSGALSVVGKGDEVIRILPENSKAWSQMLERFKVSK